MNPVATFRRSLYPRRQHELDERKAGGLITHAPRLRDGERPVRNKGHGIAVVESGKEVPMSARVADAIVLAATFLAVIYWLVVTA
ncbi:MAG: hypothetical protein AB7F76_07890 [Parvibaculaceae bacterium]